MKKETTEENPFIRNPFCIRMKNVSYVSNIEEGHVSIEFAAESAPVPQDLLDALSLIEGLRELREPQKGLLYEAVEKEIYRHLNSDALLNLIA